MVITGTQGETVVVGVFGTHAPLNFLQFLLEAVGGIVETLEHTRDATHVVVVLYGVGLVILAQGVNGVGGNQQFVGIGSYRHLIIFIYRKHHRCSQTQVGGDKLAVVASAERDFRTHVAQIET